MKLKGKEIFRLFFSFTQIKENYWADGDREPEFTIALLFRVVWFRCYCYCYQSAVSFRMTAEEQRNRTPTAVGRNPNSAVAVMVTPGVVRHQHWTSSTAGFRVVCWRESTVDERAPCTSCVGNRSHQSYPSTISLVPFWRVLSWGRLPLFS